MSRWRVLVTVVVASIALLSIPQPVTADGVQYPGASGTFSDDDGSVHEANIEAIVVAGITRGCAAGDDLFCPHDEITRAQFASFLDRALDLPEADRDYFDDDKGSVHESAINRIAAAGVTSGCTTGSYCPSMSLTRGQMATLLARAVLGLSPASEDYFSDDAGSIHERNINVMAENGITLGCRTDRYCPEDVVRRDAMASFLARALGLDPARPPATSPWRLELVIGGIEGGTTDLQAPPGDNRLFLVTKDGRIRIIRDRNFLPDPFLDIGDSVLDEGPEQGMLGLAFHPAYHWNRKFYVFYTDTAGHSQVYEYQADAADPDRADPSSARHIITFEQRPTSPVHKAGQMQFGAFGHLYIAVGDGGGHTDPFEHGENPQTELGTIIRIDIELDPDIDLPYEIPGDNPFADGVGGLPEVWAYGLRNPWRFSFDGPYIYIADVGRVDWGRGEHRRRLSRRDQLRLGCHGRARLSRASRRLREGWALRSPGRVPPRCGQGDYRWLRLSGSGHTRDGRSVFLRRLRRRMGPHSRVRRSGERALRLVPHRGTTEVRVVVRRGRAWRNVPS